MSQVPNYPANSNKSKQPQEKKQIQKVVTGSVVQKKPGLGRRISETFRGEDMNSVGSYILFEVLLPAAKTMISDAVSQGIDRALFGESRNRAANGSSVYKPGYTSYDKVAKQSTQQNRTLSKQARASHQFDMIAFFDRVDAQRVLDSMRACLEQFEVVSVMDFYDLVGVTPDFTDEKWGWTDLRSAEIRRGRDGFHILLPPTTPID